MWERCLFVMSTLDLPVLTGMLGGSLLSRYRSQSCSHSAHLIWNPSYQIQTLCWPLSVPVIHTAAAQGTKPDLTPHGVRGLATHISVEWLHGVCGLATHISGDDRTLWMKIKKEFCAFH